MFVYIINYINKYCLIIFKILKLDWLFSSDFIQCFLKYFEIFLGGYDLAEGHVFINDEIALIQRDLFVGDSIQLLLDGGKGFSFRKGLEVACDTFDF